MLTIARPTLMLRQGSQPAQILKQGAPPCRAPGTSPASPELRDAGKRCAALRGCFADGRPPDSACCTAALSSGAPEAYKTKALAGLVELLKADAENLANAQQVRFKYWAVIQLIEAIVRLIVACSSAERARPPRCVAASRRLVSECDAGC
jgi:hypothetical protein